MKRQVITFRLPSEHNNLKTPLIHSIKLQLNETGDCNWINNKIKAKHELVECHTFEEQRQVF